jgi:hypothetical protein
MTATPILAASASTTVPRVWSGTLSALPPGGRRHGSQKDSCWHYSPWFATEEDATGVPVS